MDRSNTVFTFHIFYKLATLSFVSCIVANFLLSMGRVQQVASSTLTFMGMVMKWTGVVSFFFGCYLVVLMCLVRKRLRIRAFHLIVSVGCVLLGAFFLFQSQVLVTFSVLGVD